jgi:hypothetical protein
MNEKPMLLPSDTVMRLRNYATPGTAAYKAVETAMQSRSTTGISVVTCDPACVEELLDIASRYHPQDVHVISDAYIKAFRITP